MARLKPRTRFRKTVAVRVDTRAYEYLKYLAEGNDIPITKAIDCVVREHQLMLSSKLHTFPSELKAWRETLHGEATQ